MAENAQIREQQLYQASIRLLPEIWKDRTALIELEYKKNGEGYERDFCDKMKCLLQQWTDIQAAHPKALKYVVISPLGSGVITKSYEMQIALFGEELYLDENPLCFYWTPDFIYKDVEADMERWRKEASGEIIRLMKSELCEVRRRYVLCHAYAAMHFMNRVMKQVVRLPEWEHAGGAGARILYGTYMEPMIEISQEDRLI